MPAGGVVRVPIAYDPAPADALVVIDIPAGVWALIVLLAGDTKAAFTE